MEALLNNRYRIISRVGEGGFASVYRAEDQQEGRIVAIKAISLKALSPQEMIDATDTYNREIRFGTTLNHPALPKLYDHFTDQDHWYIVAEFVEGQTLETLMREQNGGCLPVQDVLKIGLQVCDVLAYLHNRRPPVIFRDVKPDNLMRTPRGDLYLIDFGIARQFRPGQRKDTQALGSPGYAAPEQYGTAQTTECSDIYSLGATLRALLTGVNPLDASHGDYAKAGVTVPPELIALLAWMTEKDPEKRPATIEKVRARLARIAWMQEMESIARYQPFHGTLSPQPGIRPVTPTIAGKRPLWPKVLLAGLVVLIVGSASSFGLGHVQRLTFSIGIGGPPVPVTTKAPADRQVMTLPATSSGIGTLDPSAVVDLPTIQVVSMLYTGLVQLDDRMQVRPQLAVSWQRSDDGLTWTFTLRPNLKFSDGTPLTSADVAYSIDRALAPATQSTNASYYLSAIKDAGLREDGQIATLVGDSILAPDPQTIQIRTAQKAAFFLGSLTCPCAYVIEKHLIDKYGKNFGDHLDEGGSSGPFKFSHRTSKQGVELVPNPYYYGPRPQLGRVTFVVYDDSDAAYNAYLAGALTLSEVPMMRMGTAKMQSSFHQVPQLGEIYYAMNYLTKPFDNIKIRQAFALAVDKTLIAHVARQGTVLPTYHIIPQGQDGYNPNLMGPYGVNELKGNSDLAKKLLREGMQEEGISSVRQMPSITLNVPTIARTLDDAASLQQMWKQVLGVSVQINQTNYTTLLTKVDASVNNPHGLQMWYGAWLADYPDPREWTAVQFGRGSPYNAVNYGQNSSADVAQQQATQLMLQQADQETDVNARMKLYQQVEQQLVNDVAWLPLYQIEENYVLKPNVHGYVMNALDLVPPDDWGNIYISAY